MRDEVAALSARVTTLERMLGELTSAVSFCKAHGAIDVAIRAGMIGQELKLVPVDESPH